MLGIVALIAAACTTPAPIIMTVYAPPPALSDAGRACLFDPPGPLPMPRPDAGWTAEDIARALAASRQQTATVQACGRSYVITIEAWAAALTAGE